VLPLYVFVGGMLVGIGGALSMGIGAYVSSKTSTQITREKVRYLRLLFTVKSRYGSEKPETRLDDASTRSSNEGALTNPRKAGLFTGFSYLVGSLVPLFPYILLIPSPASIFLSFMFSAIALGLTGFIISVLGGIEIKRKILELMFLGWLLLPLRT